MTDPSSPASMQSVRAIERAIDVLQCFSLEHPAMTVAELGRKLGLSRPTLYRLLHTLERKGLVRSSGEPARFELGHGVAGIAHVWLARLDPARLAAPVLARLWHDTNETVALCLPQGKMRVCVLEHPGRQPLSYARGVGDVDSMAATASGRAMLAFLPPAEQEPALEDAGPERPALLRELEEVRRAGLAVSGGAIAGIRGVAAPVFDRTGRVVASVAITGPEVRLSGERLEALSAAARQAAAEVSAALGHAGGLPAEDAAP
ncbi:IclR family transcriptional regulator [Roseomonas sp. BN140053]|uniref:IclR family transcriptional regulator n=1 Tax=Roseomonas sp. BN140053 TaxID=3391898 RepID=UPI0039E7FD5A